MSYARSIGVFFFFQAEDGIRDYKVTGVQTCALPICLGDVAGLGCRGDGTDGRGMLEGLADAPGATLLLHVDRKSTRLNSSHLVISYAVFCLKKKKNTYRHVLVGTLRNDDILVVLTSY